MGMGVEERSEHGWADISAVVACSPARIRKGYYVNACTLKKSNFVVNEELVEVSSNAQSEMVNPQFLRG